MKIKKLQYIVFLADKTVSIPGQKDLFLNTLIYSEWEEKFTALLV